MRVEEFIVAEAIAQDALGGFSAIRLSQTLVFAAELPTQTKRAIYLALLDDEQLAQPGDLLQFQVVLDMPTGVTLPLFAAALPVGQKPIADLPGLLVFPAEVVIPVEQYGDYTLTASVDLRGNRLASESRQLHVLRPLNQQIPEMQIPQEQA